MVEVVGEGYGVYVVCRVDLAVDLYLGGVRGRGENEVEGQRPKSAPSTLTGDVTLL